MPIQIYNSLSRKKEEFIPLNPPQVNIYTCGVTVYDESHIGHARSLYIFGLIRKYLAFRGFKVKFVRNITDIDDKIINRANELKVDWKELVEKYIARYYEDLAVLGIERADIEPRATENIPAMVEYVRGLIEKGFAYTGGGDVYFNVRKFTQYGKLSGQSIDQMETGVRIEPTELKKDPLDFALWKNSKPGEPSWESPWGQGRPGWHIECSVMSQKFLNTQTLDIHAGGRDLIFPHHENETAQAEALTGKPFAKYWIHHGLLTINGQKMSKSLGNFVTIKDFIAKYKNADFLKLFFLSAHYAHPIDFTEEKITEAKKAYERIDILMRKADSGQAKSFKEIEEAKGKFIEAMDDDFNTPQALAVVFELVNLANKNIADNEFTLAAKQAIKELASLLGLSLNAQSGASEVSETEVLEKISQRQDARKNKDFALSDKIRQDLEAKGVILEDTKDGKTTWRRKL
ncbi:MAG: cysteine--tRNA ligase [Candidatus Omnitrophica bacterium]|nr:cysteine--tRNA ligase [Candidatus Omnitrophota bacterium]MDD5653235.1 cysteine--tRNA ligase [Candidatus Omnitrophota bacterium]